MRQLPKAIPELDGGLFLPRPVVELLEAVLATHQQALCQAAERGTDTELELTVLAELRQLLRLGERMFGEPEAGVQYFLLRGDPSRPDCDPNPDLDALVAKELEAAKKRFKGFWDAGDTVVDTYRLQKADGGETNA